MQREQWNYAIGNLPPGLLTATDLECLAYQGLELNVFGEPIEGVRLLGGVMLLNAVLAKTQGG